MSKLALAVLAAAAFLSACATEPPKQCPVENGIQQRMTSTGECTHDAADFLHGD